MSIGSKIVVLLAASFVASSASAAVLVNYDFTGQPGTQAATSATSVVSSVNASAITRGSALGSNAGGGSMNANAWNTPALNPNAYYEFTISPDSGNALNLDSIRYGNRRSGTGPTTVDLRSSLDNFASSLGSYNPPTSVGDRTFTLDAAFDNLQTSVTFRLFGYGASGSAGTFRLENGTVGGLNIDGSVSIVAPTNQAPSINITPTTITVDVSGLGLEGFDGPDAVTVTANDADGSVVSLLATNIPAQIADNLTISAVSASELTVSGANFTYADIGSYAVEFTAVDNDGAEVVSALTITVVPEPTTAAAFGAIALVVAGRRAKRMTI